MFKLTSSNYSMWTSKMRDMLVCKDLWLLVQFGKNKPDKIDASTFFGEETEADVLWKKIGAMFENKMP